LKTKLFDIAYTVYLFNVNTQPSLCAFDSLATQGDDDAIINDLID